MKHNKPFLIILCSTALIILAPFVKASNDDFNSISDKDRARHEASGVVGGAVIGGIVGGPIGAVVTAAFGNWVSEQALAKKENSLLAERLEEKDRELVAMQAQYRSMQSRYELALLEANNVKVSQGFMTVIPEVKACCQDTVLDLHFKTNAVGIEPFYNEKLRELAAIADEFPDTTIHITGHADRRGDSERNLALSRERVEAVISRLQTYGVNRTSINSDAFGENSPRSAADTLEDNFFDRRVEVRLLSTGNGLVTQHGD